MFQNSNPMVHSDLPISDLKDDTLNFEPFVKKVANGIESYDQKDCFIISIEGSWGSGKTSFIKLVENEIKDKVTILKFNPWLITNIEQLISVFFTELIKTLNYVSFGSKWDNDIKEDIKKFASAILPDQINVGVTEGTKASWKIDKYFKPKEPEAFKTLAKQKENINKYLSKLDKKILIIIDDIDRLMDNEVELIFRLIKGIADFNNIIYVLLFDKPIVSKSLKKYKSEKGQKYLEKIIQYPLTLPKAHQSRIIKELTNSLDKFLRTLGEENYYFAEETWSEVYHILNKYIFTIRDVKSILSIFKFEYVSINRDVNFVDFFVITLIKHHSIELYNLIKNNASLFNPNTLIYSEFNFDTKEDRKKYALGQLRIKFEKIDDYMDILVIIFPFLSTYNQAVHNKDHKRKAISDIHYFDNYFTMQVSDDKLATDEYIQLKDNLLNNKEIFITEIEKHESLKIKQFLEMIELDLTELDSNIDVDTKINIILELIDFIKSLDNRDFRTNQDYEDYDMNYTTWIRFIGKIIISIEDKEKLQRLCNDSYGKDKFFLRQVLRYIDSSIHKKEIHKQLIKTEQEKLKQENYTLEMLLSNKYLDQIIYTLKWIEFDFHEISEKFEENFLRKDKQNFFSILEKFIYKQISMPKKDYPYSISKSALQYLISLDKIQNYINSIEDSTLSKDEKELIKYWNNTKDW